MVLGPEVSSCRTLGVLELVCWPTGGKGQGPGGPRAGLMVVGLGPDIKAMGL